MIGRIGRLTAAEILKIVSHPFFYISVLLLVVLIPLWAHLQPQLLNQEPTEWRSRHAVQIFVYGFKPGLKVATFLILIFTSMLFAGEFDRGTIKLLLARPVTRTDFFAAKCITAVLIVLFFVALVLYVSLLFAVAGGELGPVWDQETYVTQSSHAEIVAHAQKAVLFTLLPTLAAAFLGLLVSNLTESSGYAVAGALVLFFLLDLAVDFLRHDTARYFFTFYPGYALEVLRQFAEGSSTGWRSELEDSGLQVIAPLVSVAVFVALGYARFRTRDIKV